MTAQEIIELVRGRKSQDRIDSILKDAAKDNNLVRIKYKRKKDGSTKTYVIEPYSYRKRGGNSVLFGYDKKDRRMKMFIKRNIKNASSEDKTFKPRHKVELSKEAVDLSKVTRFVKNIGGAIKENPKKTILMGSGAGLSLYGMGQMLSSALKMPNEEGMKDLMPGKKNIGKKQVELIGRAIGLKHDLHVATNTKELEAQMKKSGYGPITRKLVSFLDGNDLTEGSNAFYVPTNPKKNIKERHIIAVSPKASPTVVAHEIGHAKNFEDLGGSKAAQKAYKYGIIDDLIGTFSKKPYERAIRKPETEAWRNVPKRYQDKNLQEAALKTYDLGESSESGSKKALMGLALLGMGSSAI